MKKQKEKDVIEYIANPDDLNQDDTVILCRHEEYGMGQSYMCLGKVNKAGEQILINIISDNYGTREFEDFLESVRVCHYIRSTFDAKKGFHSGICRISKETENRIFSKQIEELNKKIKELEDSRANLIRFWAKVN